MLHIVKYLLEGLAVAIASHLVAGQKLDVKEIMMLGLSATAVFIVLDYYATDIAVGARHGAGFGIGAQMVGGSEEAEEAEEAEEIPVAAETTLSPNNPHKLVNGMYSHKVLLAGFNENAKAANTTTTHRQHRYPWGSKASASGNPCDGDQTGGAAEKAEEEQAAVPVPVQPADESSVVIEHDDNYRQADALYSGDLVDITANGAYLQRGAIDSQIIFDKPLPKVGTNLSKLRLIHPNHSKTKQTMLKYGEPVYIMHNAYFNNMNVPKYIKYGERLQSHQDGPLFRAFKVYDADNREKTGAIEPGAEVYLCRGDQDGDSVYLKVENDKTVTSKSAIDGATRFKITLRRVFESHDRNLCVCSNEIIYP